MRQFKYILCHSFSAVNKTVIMIHCFHSRPLVMNRRMKLIDIYLLNVCQGKNAFLFPNKHDQKLNDHLTAQKKKKKIDD